jgi:hypothetical protein
MPRYTKQFDGFSCGPVAICNILKWGGFNVTLKAALGPIAAVCKCSRLRGTTNYHFDRSLRLFCKGFDLHVRRKYKPKLKDIENHLRDGGVVAINYKVGTYDDGPNKGYEWRHYMLITDISEDGREFGTVNSFSGKGQRAKTYWPRAWFKKDFLRYRGYKLWLISKD